MKQFVLGHREIFQTLSNLNRINILYALYEKPQNWSDLLYDYRINSKVLRDHLRHLFNRGYVEKGEKIYLLTKEGRDLCELSFLKNIAESCEDTDKEETQ